MAMIAAYREIGKMLGYYNQPVAPDPQARYESLVRSMSDEELIAIVQNPRPREQGRMYPIM